MNPRAFDVLTRRTSDLLSRRSALGLLTGTLLAGLLHPAVACKPGHPCGGHDDDHGHGGGNGGDKKKHHRDKTEAQKACAKEAKAYTKLTDGLCIAKFYFDFGYAASCAACFDTCASYLAQCNKATAGFCTEDCGVAWGYPSTTRLSDACRCPVAGRRTTQPWIRVPPQQSGVGSGLGERIGGGLAVSLRALSPGQTALRIVGLGEVHQMIAT